MTIVEHINHGWDGVKKSFRLVWQNKILVVYVVAAVTIIGLLTALLKSIASYTFGGPDSELELVTTYPYIVAIIPLLISMIYAFTTVSAVYHVVAILNQQPASISASIKNAWSKVRYIVLLVVITQMLRFISHYMHLVLWRFGEQHHYTFLDGIMTKQNISVIGLFLQLLTFYLIPAIAIENRSFITMIKRSISYACATWVEIIIGALILLPLADIPIIIRYISRVTHDWMFFDIVLGIPAIPIFIIGRTVLLSYKTIMYVDTYKQKESILPFTQVP